MLLDVSCWNMPSTIYFNKIAKIAFSIEMEKFFFLLNLIAKEEHSCQAHTEKEKKHVWSFS